METEIHYHTHTCSLCGEVFVGLTEEESWENFCEHVRACIRSKH